MKRWAAFVPLAALFLALRSAPTPLWEVTPGPVRDVGPLIDVEGAPTYASQGNFLLTAVLVGTRPLTPFEAIRASFEPGVELVPEREIRAPGATEESEETRATSQMDQSKLDATEIVLRRLTGYPGERGRGVLVESVAAGCPADGELFAGDLILSIDGEPVDGDEHAARLIAAARPGEPLTIRLRAGGETREVRVARERCAGSEEPVVGVVLIDNFPFTVRIRSGGIGGPSAGLAWALALWDRLSPGDLTGGRKIAATGELTLGEEGIRPVGSIAQKVAAAERAGAEVFLVPRGNLAEARAVGADLEVEGSATLDEALDYLRSIGGEDGSGPAGGEAA